MKLLLDTHIWLWSLAAPGRLTRRILRELQAPANDLWLSPVSTWEVLLLCAKGRIEISPEVHRSMERSRRELQQAPLTHDIVLLAYQLPLPHADPADRFLAATAAQMGLTLVTSDHRLLELDVISVLSNRPAARR